MTRQAVARAVPRWRILHPDVGDRGNPVGFVQAADRGVDLAGPVVVPIGERRAAACAKGALHRRRGPVDGGVTLREDPRGTLDGAPGDRVGAGGAPARGAVAAG